VGDHSELLVALRSFVTTLEKKEASKRKTPQEEQDSNKDQVSSGEEENVLTYTVKMKRSEVPSKIFSIEYWQWRNKHSSFEQVYDGVGHVSRR
jgi:hypothetical protein